MKLRRLPNGQYIIVNQAGQPVGPPYPDLPSAFKAFAAQGYHQPFGPPPTVETPGGTDSPPAGQPGTPQGQPSPALASYRPDPATAARLMEMLKAAPTSMAGATGSVQMPPLGPESERPDILRSVVPGLRDLQPLHTPAGEPEFQPSTPPGAPTPGGAMPRPTEETPQGQEDIYTAGNALKKGIFVPLRQFLDQRGFGRPDQVSTRVPSDEMPEKPSKPSDEVPARPSLGQAGMRLAQATPVPTDEPLKRADRGQSVERPGYFGKEKTPAVPVPGQDKEKPSEMIKPGESEQDMIDRILGREKKSQVQEEQDVEVA